MTDHPNRAVRRALRAMSPDTLAATDNYVHRAFAERLCVVADDLRPA